MNPDPIPCRSCWRKMSGDSDVVLISTTDFPSWAATLMMADSSVSVFVIGASGATTVLPDGVTLSRWGASRMVAAVPATAPTSALSRIMPSTHMPRRGLALDRGGEGKGLIGSTGGDDGDYGSGEGGRYCGSLAIELSSILRPHLSATGQWKPREDQLL